MYYSYTSRDMIKVFQVILMLRTEVAQEVRGQNGPYLCCRTHLCLNEVSEVI